MLTFTQLSCPGTARARCSRLGEIGGRGGGRGGMGRGGVQMMVATVMVIGHSWWRIQRGSVPRT